ncbi:zinc finger SWIM domain-containing protein 1 [Pseudophryne corroboree]|uniref:zinc finger SWIM domain-containing protein 1 n=1 Tax=Pseudophryne corroboree TaxID=495146 RepID=UPI0030820618
MENIEAWTSVAPSEAIKKNSEIFKKLLEKDPDAHIAFELNKESNPNLKNVSLQTSLMSKVFANFPEVLLIVRSHNKKESALYTFMADGPRLGSSFEMSKIVYVAVPKDETHKGLAQMFRVMKSFNPCWPEIRIFLVDPYFKGAEAIYEAFPSAEVVLSAFHVCRHLQENICHLSLPTETEHILVNTLKTTMCSSTEENLRKMHSILHQYVKPSLLTQLKPAWLLVDRIWALHRWRTSSDCFVYFQTMEVMNRDFNDLYKKSFSMYSTISVLTNLIQQHSLGQGLPEVRACSLEELALLDSKNKRTETVVPESEMDFETAAMICESLNDVCIPAAFELCQKELAIAQESVRLIRDSENTANIQLFEKPSEVNWGKPKTCTCSFNKCLKLPCRHILAVLRADEEVLQPDMLSKPWQKDTEGFESMLPVSSDTLDILKGDRKNVPEKQLFVDSMTSQISQLLAECSDDVFQKRYNSLRELADAWIGPYEQVKL